MRPPQSNFPTINSLFALQSQVYSAFNRIADNVDPLFSDAARPDLSIISACTYPRDALLFEELVDAVNRLQTENSKLSGQILEPIPRGVACAPRNDPQERLRLGRMKTEVDALVTENEGLRQRIAGLDRRIDLMIRKKSYVSDLGLIRAKRPLVEHNV
jgi:hypothetical protein